MKLTAKNKSLMNWNDAIQQIASPPLPTFPPDSDDIYADLAVYHNACRLNPEIVAVDYHYAAHEFEPVFRAGYKDLEPGNSWLRVPVCFSDIDSAIAEKLLDSAYVSETQTASSASLAAGFRDPRCECHPIAGFGLAMDGRSFCRIHEVQQPWTAEEFAAAEAAKDKALDDRALAAADALKREFIILDSRGEPEYSDPQAIAAILRPFLEPKQNP